MLSKKGKRKLDWLDERSYLFPLNIEYEDWDCIGSHALNRDLLKEVCLPFLEKLITEFGNEKTPYLTEVEIFMEWLKERVKDEKTTSTKRK